MAAMLSISSLSSVANATASETDLTSVFEKSDFSDTDHLKSSDLSGWKFVYGLYNIGAENRLKGYER